MKHYKELTNIEKEQLLKFPAYISLLAANAEGIMDDVIKKAVIKFTHIKTFSGELLLREFYKEAELVFEKNIDELNRQLPKSKQERDISIRAALAKCETVLLKLGKGYAAAMHRSINSYKNHVSEAHRNILEYFIFPVPINGIL